VFAETQLELRSSPGKNHLDAESMTIEHDQDGVCLTNLQTQTFWYKQVCDGS